MATARNIIEGALRLIGAISSGENASASEISDGLTTLNDMLDSWSNENNLLFVKTREVFNLVAGQQTYTIGPGGNFDTTRPIKIIGAGLIENNIETPMDVITAFDWSQITQKTFDGSFPSKIYEESGYPFSNVIVWPTPISTLGLAIYSEKQLISFANASDTVQLPPGYNRALKYNLAIEFAPEYGKEPPSAVIAGATNSLANIKIKNSKPVISDTGLGTIGRTGPFNIITGA